MTDDGQTPPDNNWHVRKWGLTGDTKSYKAYMSHPNYPTWSTRIFQATYLDCVNAPLLTNCAQTQHKQADRLPQLIEARDACPQEQTLPYIKCSMTF